MMPGGSSTSARSPRRSRRPCASATSWSRRRCAPVFAKAKRLADRHTPSLEQEALADLIGSGAYERHVRRVRRANAERRAALLAALARTLPGAVTLAGTEAGLHIVAWLEGIPRAAEEDFVSRAANAGLGVYPISPLYDCTAHAPRPDCVGLVLGYAALTVADHRKRGRVAGRADPLAQAGVNGVDQASTTSRSDAH